MKLASFIGINNVSPPERHAAGELATAVNVDIDASKALVSRRGRTLRYADCAHSLYRAGFGLLGVVENDLVRFAADGSLAATVYFALGPSRVWFATLPDGRVAFSNGLIHGLTDGGPAVEWGVPVPTHPGVVVAGQTPYWLTFLRLADRLESAPLYCGTTLIGSVLQGLPEREGYAINVYYAPDGIAGFYAGTAADDSFHFQGENDDLVLPCQTEHLAPPPVGRCLSAWGARMLIAVGSVLWATTPFQFEQVDARRDFLQLDGDITFVHGVDAGIWIGTTEALLFLRGASLDLVALEVVRSGPVVLGSGAPADFTLFPADARPGGALSGAMCLSDGEIVACGSSGVARVFAEGQYKAGFTEVVATTRVRDGVLQYVASAA
jgi:hypothetical protein